MDECTENPHRARGKSGQERGEEGSWSGELCLRPHAGKEAEIVESWKKPSEIYEALLVFAYHPLLLFSSSL